MAPLHTFAGHAPAVHDNCIHRPHGVHHWQRSPRPGFQRLLRGVRPGRHRSHHRGTRQQPAGQCGAACDPGFPCTVGAGVGVGHAAVVHGCTVEDDCLIGMGATILNGAVIGTGSLVAAGAVVLEGTVVPPRSLVAGVPAKSGGNSPTRSSTASSRTPRATCSWPARTVSCTGSSVSRPFPARMTCRATQLR